MKASIVKEEELLLVGRPHVKLDEGNARLNRGAHRRDGVVWERLSCRATSVRSDDYASGGC